MDALKSLVRQLEAMTWAHTKRLIRMKWNLASFALVTTLWLMIYVYAVIAFTPREKLESVVPTVFWALIAWSLMSTPTTAVGSWMRNYVNMGLYDVHETMGASHRLFLATRVPPTLFVALIGGAAAAVMLYASTGVTPMRAVDPLLLAASMIVFLVISGVYGLIIAYASLLTRIPAGLLDVANLALFVAGGVAVPVESLPEPLRTAALVLPYSHPAEIMRYAATGDPPYLGLIGEAAAITAWLAFLLTAEWVMYSLVTRQVRKYGVKGIGVT